MRRRCTGRLADYGPTEIVHGVTLDVDAAEIVCLLGRSGVGKSTLVKAVMGLLKQVRGRVGVLGKQVTGWPAHRIPRLGVGYAPQELGLFQDLTVRDNLSVGLKNSGNRAATKTMFDIFPMLGARLGQRARSLSGGEQKMLILAMACLGSPELVILDEVTEGIQPAVVGRFSQLISDMTSLMAPESFALALPSRFVVMNSGVIEAEGRVTGDTVSSIQRHLVL